MKLQLCFLIVKPDCVSTKQLRHAHKTPWPQVCSQRRQLKQNTHKSLQTQPPAPLGTLKSHPLGRCTFVSII